MPVRSFREAIRHVMQQRDVHSLIVTFIAILEMIKQEELSFDKVDGLLIIGLAQGELF